MLSHDPPASPGLLPASQGARIRGPRWGQRAGKRLSRQGRISVAISGWYGSGRGWGGTACKQVDHWTTREVGGLNLDPWSEYIPGGFRDGAVHDGGSGVEQWNEWHSQWLKVDQCSWGKLVAEGRGWGRISEHARKEVIGTIGENTGVGEVDLQEKKMQDWERRESELERKKCNCNGKRKEEPKSEGKTASSASIQ